MGEAEPIGREYGNEEFMGMWEGRYPIMGVKTYPFSIGNQSGRITYWPWTVKPNGDKGPERYIVDSPNMQNARFVSMETAMAAIEESYNESGYMKQARSDQYRSSHWDEPNILAHVRFNERTDAEGKRVLFLEEIQSDWHQAGRKQGYNAGTLPDGWTVKPRAEGKDGTPGYWAVYDENGKNISMRVIKEEAITAALQGRLVPDAPFKKTWPMLAFKRMVRYAAENGFDRIAWTTGEQQAERYDLSKSFKEIAYTQITPENRNMQAQTIGEYHLEGIL